MASYGYTTCETCREKKKGCVRTHHFERCQFCMRNNLECRTKINVQKKIINKLTHFLHTTDMMDIHALVYDREFWQVQWVSEKSQIQVGQLDDQVRLFNGRNLAQALIDYALYGIDNVLDLIVNDTFRVAAEVHKNGEIPHGALVLIWDPHTAQELTSNSRKRSRASSVVAPETSFPQAYLDCGIHSPTELAEYDAKGLALLRKYQTCREWKKVKNLYARQHGARIYKHKDGTRCVQVTSKLAPEDYLTNSLELLNGYTNAICMFKVFQVDANHYVNSFKVLIFTERRILTVHTNQGNIQAWRLDSNNSFIVTTMTVLDDATTIHQYWNTGTHKVPNFFHKIMIRLVISILNFESAQDCMIPVPDQIHPIFNQFDIHTPEELVTHDINVRQCISDVLNLDTWTLLEQKEFYTSFNHSTGWLKYTHVLPISAEEGFNAAVTEPIASKNLIHLVEKIDGNHSLQTIHILTPFGKWKMNTSQRLVTEFREEGMFLRGSLTTSFLAKLFFTRFIEQEQGCILENYCLPKNKVTRKIIKYIADEHAEKVHNFFTTLPVGNETVTSYLDTLKYATMDALHADHNSWVFNQDQYKRREGILLSATTVGRAFQLATRSAEAGRFSMDALTMMQPQHELVVQTGASIVIHDYETKVNRKIWFHVESMSLFSQGEKLEPWLLKVNRFIDDTEETMLYPEQDKIAIFLHYLLSEPDIDQPDVEDLHELQWLVLAHWQAQERHDKYSFAGNLPPSPTLGTSMVTFTQDLLIIFQQDQLGLTFINTHVPRPLEVPDSLRFTALEDAFHQRIHLEDYQPFLDTIIAPFECSLQLVQGSLNENQDPAVGPCVLETEPTSLLTLTKQDQVFYLNFNHGLLEAKLRLDGSRTIFTATDGISSCARAYFDPNVSPHPIRWTRDDTWELILTPEPSWRDLHTLRGTRTSEHGHDTLVWEATIETSENSIKNTSSFESISSSDEF